MASNTGHIAIVQSLIAEGVNANARGTNGWTAIRCASAMGFLEIVRSLVAAKANVNIADEDGLTPLHGKSSRTPQDNRMTNFCRCSCKSC